MTLKQQRIVASLDIGSNKIVCLVGYLNTVGKVFVKGIGHQQSKGIKSGKIVNKKEAKKSILNAVDMAEKMAGFDIHNITISVSIPEIFSSNVNSSIKLDNKELKDKDISSLLNDIKSIFQKNEKDIIHLIPLKYVLDGNIVENPYNIEAKNLKIFFYSLSIQKDTLNNIKNCIKDIMLDIDGYVSAGYAVSYLLEKQEKELGVLILDIGSHITNIGLLYNEKYIFENSISIAGNEITDDISKILKITHETAEKIKVINADFTLLGKNEEELIKINIQTDEDFEVAKNKIGFINKIVKARVEEIINLSFQLLKDNNLDVFVKHVVLVGGTSLIPGIDNLVGDILNLPTRIGYNERININDINLSDELKNPIYSVSIGILEFIQKKHANSKDTKNQSSFFEFLKKIF